MESVGHIARRWRRTAKKARRFRRYAQMGYVSGLIVMDETGFVLVGLSRTGEAPRQLGEYLDSPALLDAALYPEKRYATRFACADGSMIDLAAVGRRMRRASSRRITERRWNISMRFGCPSR